MSFFDEQEHARRATGRLMLLFGLAVAALIAGLYAAVVLLQAVPWSRHRYQPAPPVHITWWQPELLFWIAVTSLAAIGLATWSKMRALDAGGGGIALSFGARQILGHTTDERERRLLNIVEEMAIASGVRVPFVFVLDNERGINAFAAGFTPADAAITVTRGSLTQLDRDQLQGIIGHEFSHILNGDMGLNVRLIGLLYGILFIGHTGLVILRASATPGRRGGFTPGIVVGLILAALGYLGVFCGRLIRAAVCRQREFLADASAVQFTRNPYGIAGALQQIADHDAGSRIDAPHAEELAHFFFGEALVTNWWRWLWATHPPVATRIAHILPNYRGNLEDLQAEAPQPAHDPEQALVFAVDPPTSYSPTLHPPMRQTPLPAQVMQTVAAPTVAHLAEGRALLAAIPQSLRGVIGDPLGAMAAVLALLLDDDVQVRARQLGSLRASPVPGLESECLRLAPQLAALDVRLRLPVVELAVPALRHLSQPQLRSFVACLQELALADGQRSVFEYALQRLLLRRLVAPGKQRLRLAPYTDDAQLERDGVVLLSALAWAGSPGPQEAQAAFAAGAERLLAPDAGLGLMPPEDAGFQALDAALGRLPGAPLQLRLQLVDACAHVVLADGQVLAQEAELLRSMADALDCPIPPFLP